MRLPLSIFLFTLFIACNNTDARFKSNRSSQGEHIALEDSNSALKQVEPIADREVHESLETNEHSVPFKFEAFIVEFDSLDIWEGQNAVDEKRSDSTEVFLELGETIEGVHATITPIKDIELKVFQRFETSVTVMRDGPHCDLTEWKHYNSPWNELSISNGQFVSDVYSKEDWGKFIDVDMREVREAVRTECGDEWATYMEEVKSPSEYPCGVSISRVFFKFEQINKADGSSKESIIAFGIPMGC